MNDKEFKEELSKLGIVLTSTQEKQLEMYYNCIATIKTYGRKKEKN
mgnify:CR=1 FL=1